MACENCGCYLTTIYSSYSVEVLRDLVTCMSVAFGLGGRTIDDLFCYGVFCRDETYANFSSWPEDPDFDIPCEITDFCSSESSRVAYVHELIDDIMCGDAEKPEWMLYVEEESEECGAAPSTFLRLNAREGRYQCLADLLVDFLYSPNKSVTMLRDN